MTERGPAVQVGTAQVVAIIASLLALAALTVGLFVTRFEFAMLGERVQRIERLQDAERHQTPPTQPQ